MATMASEPPTVQRVSAVAPPAAPGWSGALDTTTNPCRSGPREVAALGRPIIESRAVQSPGATEHNAALGALEQVRAARARRTWETGMTAAFRLTRPRSTG